MFLGFRLLSQKIADFRFSDLPSLVLSQYLFDWKYAHYHLRGNLHLDALFVGGHVIHVQLHPMDFYIHSSILDFHTGLSSSS